MAKVYGGGKAPGDRVFRPVERRHLPRSRASTPTASSAGPTYALSLLALQPRVGAGPLRRSSGCRATCRSTPTTRTGVTPALSFNTAVSFLTNTNWQNYSGESTMSHLTQMAGLAVHNFVSAAAGAAVAVALIRGLVRRRTHTLGNFWVDLVRTTDSASCCRWRSSFALVLVSQGVIQNFHAAKTVTTVDGPDADDPGRPDRQPGGDQGARQERRRLLQRQLGAPVREPEPDHQHPRDLAAPRDPVRVHRGRSGRWPGTRSRASRCSRAMFVLWLAVAAGRHAVRGRTATRSSTAVGVDQTVTVDAVRRQHGGQGDALRPADVGPVRGVDDRHVDRLGQLACTTASRRSAARCRSST